jgi:ribose 5-phosphate isomerase B
MSKFTIGVGCDEAALHLKETGALFGKVGHTVKDYGVYNTEPSLYPDIALEVANAVAEGEHERGY